MQKQHGRLCQQKWLRMEYILIGDVKHIALQEKNKKNFNIIACFSILTSW